MKALIILLLLPLQLLSQDMSGIWTGFIHTQGNDLSYELVISETKEKLSGYSLTIFMIDGIENVGIKTAIFKKKKGNISIEDDQLIYNNYSTPPKRVKLFALLSLKMEDSIMTLSGEFHTKTRDYRASDNNSYTGTITLQKQKNSKETRLIVQLGKMNLLNTLSFIQPKAKEKEKPAIAKPKAPQPAIIKKPEAPVTVNAAAAIAERKTEVIRSVFFRSDSLVLSLYDNGTVDGDTVSVVLNGKIIIAKKGLTENAVSLVVQMTPDLGDSLLLTMYAENLGAIAPNTGILIIQDGNDRSEIRFEGDMQKNSAVILRRKR